MSTERLNQLLSYYKEDPNDPFNIYALALEFQKSDLNKADDFYTILLSEHENYIPTYYHAAKLYQELGKKEKAIAVYEKGIEVAKKKADLKAVRELQSAYDELMFE